jgi:Protein of unknown function (DUF1439)
MKKFSVLLLALLVGCAVMPFINREVVFTTDELTNRLVKRFPVERNIADLVKVTLTRPRLTVIENPAASNQARRLSVAVDVEVKLPLTAKSLWGQMSLSGLPRYDTATRGIFLTDTKLDRVRVDNMPDALSAALAKTASQLAKEYFEDKAIYTFEAKDVQRLGQTVTPERIDLRTNQLVLVLK